MDWMDASFVSRANKSGFRTSVVPSDFPTFEDLCSAADDELFTKTSTFSNHILHAFLPPESTYRGTMIWPQMAYTPLSVLWTLHPSF